MKPEPEDAVIPAMYYHALPIATRIGREHGYAIGLHGSMRRDLDLVAVPWVDDAQPAEMLARAIYERTSARSDVLPFEQLPAPALRPHGRMAWVLPLGGGLAIDLSVMPPANGR